MKSKLFLLSFLMLLTVATNYAQGIAVQGIARDANNTAKTNVDLTFNFTIYYKNADGTPNTSVTITQVLKTDAFGVFSYVIPAAAIDNTTLLEKELYLKIEQMTAPVAIISDEKLNYVPYAMSASNGVPTGSIMPYMGATAPTGWLLCDGSDLPATATALKVLLKIEGNTGDKTPDLRGMFLRGARDNGNSVYGDQIFEHNVGTFQSSSNKKHSHNQGTLVTSTAGNHNHGSTSTTNKLIYTNGDDTTPGGVDKTLNEVNLHSSSEIPLDGNHIHTITGLTGDTGDDESRPVNYAVNYIIKL